MDYGSLGNGSGYGLGGWKMNKKGKTSVKLSGEAIEFLKNFRKNRIKADIDEDYSSYSDLLEIIVKYFKLKNERYLEVVKLVVTKNAR